MGIKFYMKKKYIIFILVLAATSVSALKINKWRYTENGKLDWKVAIILKIINLYSPSYDKYKPQEIRKKINKGIIRTHLKTVSLSRVENILIPGEENKISVRIYYPELRNSGYQNQFRGHRIIVYYHGGGFLQGNLDTHDNVCRSLAKKSKSIVFSVDYRLAPENPYPAAIEDAYTSLVWAHQNAKSIGGDPNKIIVAGDSAGGNLAAVVTHMSRDRNGPKIALQVLMYPAVDLASEKMTESYEKFGHGFFLTEERMRRLRSFYIPNPQNRREPYASPLLAKNFKNLPPAVIIGAKFDPLRDQGIAYAEKLKKAGVPVHYYIYKDVIHGFVNMGFLSQSRDAIGKMSKVVQSF